MRYVVTGAAGFVGSHLTEALLATGHEVVAVDCFTDYYDRALKEENAAAFRVERIDLTRERLDLDEVDGIFHLAGQPGARSFGTGFRRYLENNTLASQRVFEAAAGAGVRVVFASSSSVYGNTTVYPTGESAELAPRTPYGVTKLACEHLADAYRMSFGLDVVVLRYFTVYGPRQRPDMFCARVVRALVDGTTFELYGDGSQSRGFTHVDDVVRATVDAMARAPAGAVYNVGARDEAALGEVVAILEQLAGRSIDLARLPPAAGDVARTMADTTLIRAELGWQPAVQLDEGLRAQWEWTTGSCSLAIGSGPP